MAGWKLKRGMPEWHEVMTYRAALRCGAVITAQTEDCDGDIEYWWVKENDALVAFGEGDNDESAREKAERVICFGATDEDVLAANLELQRGLNA